MKWILALVLAFCLSACSAAESAPAATVAPVPAATPAPTPAPTPEPTPEPTPLPARISLVNADGEEYGYSLLEYDEEGRCVKENKYRIAGDEYIGCEEYEYYENSGQASVWRHYFEDGALNWVTHYREDGSKEALSRTFPLHSVKYGAIMHSIEWGAGLSRLRRC